jgi:flavorubredoxin
MENKSKVLFDDGEHKCIMFSFDDEAHEDSYLSVNQFLIVQHGTGVLIDPGSEAIFDELYDAVSEYVEINQIKFIFFSHQDPDVSGSIGQWAATTPAKFIMSSLWVRFMSHYGFMDMARVMSLPDHGAKIKFGNDALKFLPAHFLHSPGNFTLYDTRSRIAFSGDIGAAILPSNEGEKAVENFEEHTKALEGFHKRYMGSNKLCKAWVETMRKHEIHMIAPQHGFVFKDEDVEKFLEWLSELQCGSDNMDELY